MEEHVLGERRRALEEEFFRKQNAELLARLRATLAREEARELLASVSGVHDPSVLDLMIDQDLTPASISILSLVPLVAVAWADRNLHDEERRVILQEVTAMGMGPGSPGYELLENWLLQQPPSSLMTAWSEYTKAFLQTLSPDQRRKLHDTLLKRVQAVAKAAGGFAGIGSRVSEVERATLDVIEGVLSR